MPILVPLIFVCAHCGAEVPVRGHLNSTWGITLAAPNGEPTDPSRWGPDGNRRYLNTKGGDGPQVWCNRVECDADYRRAQAHAEAESAAAAPSRS